MVSWEWSLKSSREILDLKVCDPAMGSGAFLVQACRYLGEKLVEAWLHEESAGKAITVYGEALDQLGAEEPLPSQLDERLTIARRLVAERCLYGVDINPLAVELAKLSIWLVTLAKGRPFGFFDHNLRCGDSLLGIHRLGQLTEFSLHPGNGGQRHLFGRKIEEAVNEAVAKRRELRAVAVRDIRDVEEMERLHREARNKIENVRLVADALIGEALRCGGNARALEGALSELASFAGEFLEGKAERRGQLERQAQEALSVDLPAEKPVRRPLHWPLEFPEVFERGGCDGIVGNPPFVGGQRITGILGTAFRDWLVAFIAGGQRGSADLSAYFFLRAWNLLGNGGNFGLLAVNTIAEGDTRQVGLEAMVAAGAVIYAAYPNEPWPGKAAVVTSRVYVHKGTWAGAHILSGQPVPVISAFLSGHKEWTAKRLKANVGLAFQGCIVRGIGFVLSTDEAQRMLDADPRNAEVIFPYLNGDDLNSDPEQRPSRWVINFWDWSEQRAREYQLPWRWIEARVKSDRYRKRKDGRFVCAEHLRKEWWLFEGRRIGLFHAIGRGQYFERRQENKRNDKEWLENIIVSARITKYFAPSYCKNNIVTSDTVVIFSKNNYNYFALLNSSFCESWIIQISSHMGMTIRFSPTDSIETLAMPSDVKFNKEIDIISNEFECSRREYMRKRQVGLTSFYNIFHSEDIYEPDIEKLRSLRCKIDVEIARAYGWDDLNLTHGFHSVSCLPENDRVRFTISERARLEVLRRLSELNRQRYEEEVAQGLHGNARPTAPRHQLRTAAVS